MINEYPTELSGNSTADDKIKKTLLSQADLDRLKLQEPKRRVALHQYPLDLGVSGDRNIIKFDINVPVGSRFEADNKNQNTTDKPIPVQTGGNSLLGKSNKTTKYTRTTTSIGLYMPDEVSTVYTSNWQSRELGIAAGASKVLSNFDSLLSTDGAKTIMKAAGEGFASTITGAVQNPTPFQIQDVRNFGKAQIKNPYIEVLFDGIENRPFNFSFKFMPRNEKESVEVKNICEAFRYHQAPEFKYAENNLESYLMYPSTFDITFLHEGDENNWLHKISTCALRSVSVNHSSDAGFKTHDNGAPVVTTLTLEFIELELLTKDRIKQGY